MSRPYEVLKGRIKAVASTQREYEYMNELVREHFEGKIVFSKMPDVLKLVVAQWENEQTNQQED